MWRLSCRFLILPPDHYNPCFSTQSVFEMISLCWYSLFLIFSAIQSNATLLNGHWVVSECFSAALYPWGMEGSLFVFVETVCRIRSGFLRRCWITVNCYENHCSLSGSSQLLLTRWIKCFIPLHLQSLCVLFRNIFIINIEIKNSSKPAVMK